MVADAPLSRMVLSAASVADDLGYVALADLSRVLGSAAGTRHRLIGGHMVTALVTRWQLGAALYRETGDADLGVPPILVRDGGLVEQLMGLGYEHVAGHRFARAVTDVPVRAAGRKESPRKAIIDLLVPAYTSRPRQDHRIGELLVTEVPGLSLALQRAPVTMALELHRLNGQMLEAELSLADEVSALVMKSCATRDRRRATDIVDVWRCLEVAFAAGVDSSEFAKGLPAESAEIVRALFGDRNGAGMAALVVEQRLAGPSADERFTRLRALMQRVLGPG